MIPAAAYFRMSDDVQDTSIPSQRPAVERLATDGGFKIVAEYKDEGISGDATDRRKDFQRMHADALAGKFKAILCWDSDRFGRFDSIEAGYWIHPLRVAGVKLVTVTEGPINWDDFTGRVMYSLKQEGKHQYVRDLSRNVLRGMSDKAKAGQWTSGRPPLGYVVDDGRRLALGDARSVAIVREIFDRYLSGHSLRSLVEHLNAKGYQTAGGKSWEYVGVRTILKNPNYTGDLHWNLRNPSKYSSLRAGRVESTPQAKFLTASADWIVVANSHPAIIPRATFEAAQARLQSNRHRSTPHPNGGGFVLSGLLRCAKCGSAMTGATYGGLRYYVCCGYYHRGASFCQRNAVRQEGLLELTAATLTEHFECRHTRAAIKRLVELQMANQATKEATGDVAKQLAAVRKQLATAERNMALASSDDLRRRYESVVSDLAAQEQAIAAKQADSKRSKTVRIDDLRSRMDLAMQWLGNLKAALVAGDATGQRELLREAVQRINVTVRKEMRTRRGRFYLDSGEIVLKSENLLATDHHSNQVLRFRAG